MKVLFNFTSPVICFLLLCNSTVGCHSQLPKTGSVDEAAANARAAGKTDVTMDPGFRHPRRIESFDEEMKTGYALIVRLTASSSAVSPQRTTIATWYKLTVINDLSPRPLPAATESQPSEKDIPQELLPIRSGDILIEQSGGRVNLDGVAVSWRYPGPIFKPGRDYLVIVQPTSESGWLFGLSGDAETVFTVGDDGDTLTPRAPGQRAMGLQEDMKNRFGNSLNRVRRARGANP